MRPRLLFVAADLYYTNPTGYLIPAVLDRVGDVVFFGPGFVSTAVLDRGLKRFVDANGPFDFAVTTEMVAITANRLNPDLLIERVRRTYSFRFPVSDLRFLPRIAADWQKLPIIRLVSLLQDDLYNWTSGHVELALASSDVILGNGLENVVKVDVMQNTDSEPWAKRATDHFVDFVESAPNRFASFPLFVSDSEVCRVSHFARKRQWAVPGVHYHSRRIVANHLERAGYRFRRTSPSIFIHKFAEIMGWMPRSSVALAQYFFRRELETAKAVFTCGSVLQQPIRKFFEVPAAGALLVCQPCAGLKDYGFEHDVSCLMISPDRILDADQLRLHEPERAQKIARLGQQVVIRKHTIPARAAQLAAVLHRMKQGTFAGARWKEGQYLFAEPSSTNESKTKYP
jgi:hypothetical protein